MLKNFFATWCAIISVGIFIGILAPLLQKWGNPGNMGICVACFERDIAGSLGLHRAVVVQYMRPEIIGFVLGSLLAAYLFREFRPRAGSAPIVGFVLGVFAMIGALTGIVSALIYGGYAIEEASILAARINRLAGELARPTPGTQVSEIIMHIPGALSMALEKIYKKQEESHEKRTFNRG